MKLMRVTIQGYKRFFEKTSINLHGKTIALVGPNEAGKSSLLSAIQHLKNQNEFVTQGIEQELTRDEDIPFNQRVIQFKFILEAEDIEKISHIHGGNKVKWLTWIKYADGDWGFILDPTPKRDLRKRNTVQGQLEKMLASPTIQKIKENIPLTPLPDNKKHPEEIFFEEVEALIKSLDTNKETLPQQDINLIIRISKRLVSLITEDFPKYIQELPTILERLSIIESDASPSDLIEDILEHKIPTVLFFSENDRLINSRYQIVINSDPLPAPLVNLANLAGLDLERLGNAITNRDQAVISTLVRSANESLQEIYSKWSQSEGFVSFGVNGATLSILIDEAGEYTEIAERSDGLKYFIALVAFIRSKQVERPILLIDEIEQHLHYDAQADLMQMLAKQDIVSKVIYSTHSIGCLPEDLGLGIRAIEVDKERKGRSERSKINNWFWVNNQPGIAPLLSAVGATTLAFLPMRNAILTEGITDVILLPTLLREVMELDHLGFQIIPGLSSASEDQIAILNNEASRVMYFVDSDDGGEKILEKIKNAGILDEKIIKLSEEPNCEIEDFINPKIYCQVVNQLLRQYDYDLKFEETEIPPNLRSNYVKTKCSENEIQLSKREIAYEILEFAGINPIASDKHKKRLIEIYERIKSDLLE